MDGKRRPGFLNGPGGKDDRQVRFDGGLEPRRCLRHAAGGEAREDREFSVPQHVLLA